MDKGKEEALRELLKVIVDNPSLADRIVITIRPNKDTQGKQKS